MAKTRKPARRLSTPSVSAIAEALEPRVLFSADLAPLALSTSGSGSQVVEQARQTSSVAPVNATTSQLFVVDLRIADAKGLLSGLIQQQTEAQSSGEQFEILTLDANDDGITRISQALAKQGNVSGLHLLGHGEDGRMLLGNSWIDENSLRSRAADYSQWSIGLSADADVLLYGCDFAISGNGKQSVQAIAQLTGADVAASTDVTANASRAGNWVLEYQTGSIEATTLAASTAAAGSQWQGKLATFSVTNTADSGAGSLRDAIVAANASAGADLITFNIAGAGVHTIDLLSSLPDVTDTVVIDGATQSGYSNTPLIELNGVSAGTADGIKLSSGSNGSTVRGLVLNRFSGAGIHILSNSNTIIGNYVGTNFDGTSASSNSFSGIFINDSAGNLIGGVTASERNVVSGNLDAGIYIFGSSGTGNTVVGNYVGTNAAGSAKVGNGSEGIVVLFGAYNLIGGFNPGEGNLVSGNTDNGISLYQSNHNIVRGNIVGMDATGTAVIANGQSGISLNLANFERIGGSGLGEGNRVAGNLQSGVYFKDSNNTTIQGNVIGESSASIIIGNVGAGVVGAGTSSNALVGGVNASEANIIAGNNVGIAQTVGTGTNNAFLGNRVYSNISIGIDLLWDGVTLNDAGADPDLGPNGLQNFPLLYAANSTAGVTLITGEFNSNANTAYRIEFFSSPSGDATGYGEGPTYLGFSNVTTDGAGRANINASLSSVSVPFGQSVAATATVNLGAGTFGATSEFSQNVVSTVGTPGVTVTQPTVPITTESGGTASFSIVLNAAPSSNVTINLNSSDPTEGSIAISTLTFTPLNWNVAQTVTVTGVNDYLLDGAIGYNIITSTLISADVGFNGLSVADISLTTPDDDSYNTLIVDTVSDVFDGDTGSIAALYANRGPDGKISLREAIFAAGNTPNPMGTVNHIHFNIQDPLVGGAHTISLTGALPTIVQAVVIDGSTEPDWAANGNRPVVVIDGNNLSATGLQFNGTSGGSTFRGLVIRNFSGTAILLMTGANGITIAGNYIGSLNTSGSYLGPGSENDFGGIYVDSSNNTIGGTGAFDRNVISGNLTSAITLHGSSGNLIQNNFIGSDAAGAALIGNTGDGVLLLNGSAGNQIGSAGFGNLIVGNNNGVSVHDAGSNNNKIQSNIIGTDLSLALNWANVQEGIEILFGASFNLIGGVNAGEGNVIFNNGSTAWAAISIEDTSTGNAILGNRIDNSFGLGIQLGWGSTLPLPNDLGDGDTGANDQHNYPVLVSATVAGGNTTILGTMNSIANQPFRIEFFSSPLGDPTGYGEARNYLGFITGTTNASGNASFTAALSGVAVPVGFAVTATATVELGGGVYRSTSEFAQNVLVSGPSGISVSAPTGAVTTEGGSSVSFTVVLNSPPLADVTIAVSTTDASEGVASVSSLTFSAANWNLVQTVQVTGVSDLFIDGSIGYSIVLSPAVSSDPAYNGINASDVSLSNLDNDAFNTLVVDTTSDAADGDTSSIAALYANKGIDGKISLREAIIAANNTINGVGGADHINFDIADPLINGAHTITVLSELTKITDAVFIDGYSQSSTAQNSLVIGSNAQLQIEISGNLTFNANGLFLDFGSDGSTIQGLIISGFLGDGAPAGHGVLVSSSNNLIQGNYIGVRNDGMIQSNWAGIVLNTSATGNLIGGSLPSQRNVVSGNSNGAISILGVANTDNSIQGNFIGLAPDGVTTRANNNYGILVWGGATAIKIGGTATGEGNLIHANSGVGVQVAVSSFASILGNSISANSGLGIDLNGDGVTLNDVGDTDSGGNNLQNFPTLISSNSTGGNTSIRFSLESNANTTYRVEFFSSPIADLSGYGEALTFLGFTTVTTDAAGFSTANLTLSGVSVAVGHQVSATATVDNGAGGYGPTSEFSKNVIVSVAPPGVTVSSPNALTTNEAGTTVQFSLVLNSPPSADAIITLVLSDSSEATLSTTTLVFNAANWNISQIVTVTGADDSYVDGNIAYAVVTSNVVSSDPAYSGLVVLDIALTNMDNDTSNTLVVDTTSDAADGDTSSVAALYANRGVDGKISLREAIIAANNTANGSQRDSILFNIADPLMGGAHTINVLSQLPTVTNAVLIDGSSEPDFGSNHVVELRGDGAGVLAAGLVVTASDSQINGLTINRFNGNGLSILGINNNLTNNYIGTSISGAAGLGNGVHGIYLFNAGNTSIGGATAGLGNVVSGNGQNGIEIRDSSGTLVRNNLIGTAASGTSIIANGSSGVYVVGSTSLSTVIGGSSTTGNLIGGSLLSGIALDASVSGVTISNNSIGTDRLGLLGLGNVGPGIYSNAYSVTIANNLIAFNGFSGIEIRGSESTVNLNDIRFEGKGVVVAASAVGVTITNNVMDNVGLLIDLGNDGLSVSVNDAGDIDTGPNDLMNTAVIGSVSSDGVGQIRVAGSFNGQANRNLTVDVYEHSTVGIGQRSRFVGSFTIATDAAGNASFNQILSGAFPTGSLFSSTVTDTTTLLNRSTSEHSNAVAAVAPGVVVTPTSGLIVNESGTSTTVSFALSAAPTADVTINFSVSVLGEVNLSTISLTFTVANWNVPQLLTITGLQDFVSDGDQVVTIMTSAAVSADPSYSGLSVADITVTNQAIPNVAPVINSPATYNVTEDTPVTFSSGISLSDADAGNNPLDVTLTVSNGVFSLGTVAGLSFFAGDGTADASMTFSGTVAQINAAIDSLTFTPTANFAGTMGLSLFVNDLGNTGSGGAQGASTNIPIIVAPVNDAATFSGTKLGALNEGAVLKITSSMLRLADIDNPTNDLVFTVITQTADGELQRSGTTLRVGDSFTEADIDNGLIDYVHFSGENPTASITLGLTERFGGSLPDVTLNLTVAPVNDAPMITGLTGGTIAEITTAGAVVGTATVTDADNAAGTAFSLSNDDNATFAIDAVTGVITVLNPLQLDYETAPQHTIRVKVTDASGASTERNFTIELADVPEFVPTGETPTIAPPTGIVPPVLVAPTNVPTNAPTVTITPISSLTNALGPASPAGVNPVTQAVSAGNSNGNGKARQLEKENEVWVDNSQEAKALALKDAKRRFVGAIDLELLDAAGNVRQRRSLNSDALDLLFRSRKNAGTFTTPPMVLLGEFKLPASAQSGVVDEGSMVPSATQSRMNVVIDSIEVGGVVMSVGVVAWVARTGGLLAALISAMPAWKGLDPLLVLSPSKSNKMKATQDFEEFSDTDLREDEEAVQAVLS